MSLLGYPEYAVDEEGNERPWVTGPSPISQALLATGLGLLANNKVSPWVGGGTDFSRIGEAGLLGLKQYGLASDSLQKARKDYYDDFRATQDQIRENDLHALKFKTLDQKRKHFPNLIKQLRAINDPEINTKINTLAQLGRADINSAYNAATNMLSTASKKQWGKPELIDGSLFQKTKEGEWKYIATPSKTPDISKLSAPEIMGQLINSSTKLQEWSYEGGGALSKKPGMSAKNYDSLYRLKMRMDTKDIKLKDRLGNETVKLIREKLASVIEPEAYAIMSGLTPEEIKAYGINKPLIDTKEFTSEAKRTITEAKDIGKVGLIAQVENGLEQQTARYDPTKVTAQSYINYLTDGISPFRGEARSYEQMALTGSRMFGYLFSGATVKDDENRAMRIALYPFPGDSLDDVNRKRNFRRTIIDLYKTYIHPDVGDKLFKTIINNANNNRITTSQEVEEIVASDNSTSQSPPILNSEQSQNTLNNIWEQAR